MKFLFHTNEQDRVSTGARITIRFTMLGTVTVFPVGKVLSERDVEILVTTEQKGKV